MDTAPGTLLVHVPEWVVAEDLRTFTAGDQLCCWLTLREAGRGWLPPFCHQRLTGTASPLPAWPGTEPGRSPVRVDVAGAVLHWDAPGPLTGPVAVEGELHHNTVHAPAGLPMTRGTVVRVWMEWATLRPAGEPDAWAVDWATARYEEVERSSLPGLGELPDYRHPQWTGVLVELEPTGTEPA